MTQEAGSLTRSAIVALTALMCFWGVQAMAVDGLTTIRSSHGPKDTMNRLEAAVNAKGLRASITRRGPRRSDYRCGRPNS